MTDTNEIVQAVYRGFNARDIDAVFLHLRDDVDWPKAFKGTRARGKDAVRAYWTEQWREIDPHVEPLRITERGAETVVEVHQVVRDLQGGLLLEGNVWHVYRIVNGLIARMDVHEAEPAAA